MLADAGLRVSEARPAGIEQTFELIAGLFGADGGAGIQTLLSIAGTQQPSALLMEMASVVQPFATSAAGLSGLLAQWDMFRARLLTFFDEFDAIVAPACAFPAPPHGTTLQPEHLPGFSYTMTYDLTGWPAVVVRAGTSPAGLPIAVQVVAPPWREDVALALAQRIEAALGGWQAPPL